MPLEALLKPKGEEGDDEDEDEDESEFMDLEDFGVTPQ
jgi:hypothetical protein